MSEATLPPALPEATESGGFFYYFRKAFGFLLADMKKFASSWTSVINLAFLALAITQLVLPWGEWRGMAHAEAELNTLRLSMASAQSDAVQWRSTAEANETARKALETRVAELENKLKVARADPAPAATETAPPATPPVKVAKVRPRAVVRKPEPSTCDQIDACKQFLAWYEQNVSPPPAPFVPLQP